MDQIHKILLALQIMIFMGCNEHFYHPDLYPPSPPQGLYAFAGDQIVELYWNENPETDVTGYNVFIAVSSNDRYEYVGSTRNAYFADNVARNGTTYYYRVSAYDFDGNESSLSREVAYATPRPEKYGEILMDYRSYPDQAGFDFSTETVGWYDDRYTDIFFEYHEGTYYMDVWNDTEIQDLGYTKSLYEVIYSPTSGWSPTKDVRLIVGHTYVVRTWDYRYAKIRITSLSTARVVFDWSYQLQQYNKQLKITLPQERDSLRSGSGRNGRP